MRTCHCSGTSQLRSQDKADIASLTYSCWYVPCKGKGLGVPWPLCTGSTRGALGRAGRAILKCGEAQVAVRHMLTCLYLNAKFFSYLAGSYVVCC